VGYLVKVTINLLLWTTDIVCIVWSNCIAFFSLLYLPRSHCKLFKCSLVCMDRYI